MNKLGEILATNDGGLFLKFNDDIGKIINEKGLSGEAIDLADEVLTFLEKVLGGDIDED